MDRYKQYIDKHRFLFNSMLHQYKGKQNYLLVRMKRNVEPEFHIMTYIRGKNTFIDEKMEGLQENQCLFLLKFGLDAVYLILTEDGNNYIPV